MAFPLTTEAALCSCFRILLQDLAPIVRSRDLLRFWEIDDQELKLFQKNISKVQDLLNSAEERSLEKGVSNWMDDLRELSYDMENLVDEMNRKRVWMEQHVAILNQARTSHDAAHDYTYWDIKEPRIMKTTEDYGPQVKTIKEGINGASARLKEVLVEANGLKLKPHALGRSPMSSIPSRIKDDVGPYVDESDVYGRQKDKDIVIQELLSSTHSSRKNYSVFSIVGMGGVGKTTLARIIFHDERVEFFDVRSWACVSDAFDSEKVVKELIGYVPGDYVSTTAPSALHSRLVDMVKGKKILIVLDDVWEVKAWGSLKVLFTHCAEGSKILVTTRDKSVGNYISDKKCYELKSLEDEDCWHLFKGVAFGEVVDENLERIGREIVKKCKGVPLAVKVIGSTLMFASEERWENALKNELWQVELGECDEIFPALKLSYRYLPSPIKRCFGYLSLFPTDYTLEQDKVVRLWIAEGFIEDREGRSWEDIGHEYYKELQRRCLIQENDMMHDVIHSLACFVSGKFSHRIANGTNSSMHVESVRHLSVIDGNMDTEAFDEMKHLRTLFLFRSHFSEKICHQCLLRVLYLRGATLQELPSSVKNLKCLRHLELSWNHKIESLPDSICELRNLHTLDLHYCSGFRSLPNDIGNLQKLRSLRLQSTSLSVLPTSIGKLLNLLVLDLNYCPDLSRIPEDIGNLVSLRELNLHYTGISSLPDSICKLKNLQVLNLDDCESFSNLPDETGALQDLMELNLCGTSISHLPKSIGNLCNLRNLHISYCERLTQLPEAIGNLVSLRELHLDKAPISSLPDSICKLEKLQHLNLDACRSFSNLHDEIGALQHLSELNLSCTSISLLPKSIGNLRNLRNLYISYCERLTHLPEAIGNLVSLRKLNLHKAPISSLPDSICKLEKLHVLNLRSCKSFSNLPDEIGALQDLRELDLFSTSISHLPKSIGNLHNLRNLHISYCEKLTQLPEAIGNLVSIRELDLQKAPISSLPDSICKLEKLQVLNLRFCKSFSNLPNEIGALQDLRELNLSSTSISHLPKSIGNLRNLRNLHISFCERLTQLPEAIGNLVSLRELHLVESSISSLPDSICKLKKLRVLQLRYCISFSNLPDEIGALEDLTELNLYATSISHLPKSIGNLYNLRNLNIDGCERLTQLPEDVCNLSSLEKFEFDRNLERRLPRGIGRLRNIERLDEFIVGKEEGWGIEELNGMNKLKGSLTILHLENVDSVEKALMASLKSKIDIDHLYFKWSSLDDASDVGVGLTTRDGEMEANVLEALEPYPAGLVTLSLENYYGERVPTWMAELRFASLNELIIDGLLCVVRVMDVELPSLKLLKIENCPKLRVVSMGIPNLQSLHVSSCEEFTTLCMIPSLQGFSYASEIRSLKEMHIIKCPGLVPFLDERLPPMLQKLKIASCTNLRHLPRGLQHNTSLHSLWIRDCPELVSFPGEGLPPMLQNLEIASCTTLQHLPGLQHITSLQSLSIEDCPELVSFPVEGLPPMLLFLKIASLKNLPHLLRGLPHNTSLATLAIKDFPELVSFPEERLPPTLRNLRIESCTTLRHLPRGLHYNTSLHLLWIKDCPELVSFPEEGLPPMLCRLSIINCTNLRHLPTGLRDLTSLYSLKLERCPVLGVRSDDQLPPRLLPEIVNCSKLEQQLKDEDRKDWLTKSFSK